MTRSGGNWTRVVKGTFDLEFLRAVIPTPSLRTPPLPRHDCAKLGAYLASSSFHLMTGRGVTAIIS